MSILRRLAAWRVLSCCLVATLALLVRLALLPILPEPNPSVHDEFSYILGGETFAMGRLANPRHPLAPFFETYHVNVEPEYASKYPPGQAMFLALGIRLFGDPWYGVWISVGLMCGLLTWMLQGWAPPKFALLGGALTVPWFAVSHYWMNSYWGGAVAACGGAMVLGALPRMISRPTPWHASVGAVGLAALANTRPFEGAVLALACLIAPLCQSNNKARFGKFLKFPVVLPIGLISFLTVGFMALYNYRLTGSPITLPYSLNQQRYAATPIFWVEPPPAPEHRDYRDPAMQEYWEVSDANTYTSTRQMPWRTLAKFVEATSGLMSSAGKALIWPLALSIFLVHLRRVRAAIIIGAVVAGGFMLQKYSQPHYLSPATGVILILAVFGLRLVRAVRIRGRPVGLAMVVCIVGIALVASALDLKQAIADHPEPWAFRSAMDFRRQVEAKLEQESGLHLVIVRYGDAHNPGDEQVYNGPDIDRQKIIWAFDRGAVENRTLLQYYDGRKFWLLRPDPPHPRFDPYVEGVEAHD
jgi:hypothetical protein